MNPMIIFIFILIVSFVSFFIAYSEEKKQTFADKKIKESYVDDPAILFDDNLQDDDIEII